MAEITGITRYTAVLGPFKLEVAEGTASDGETFTSRMQRPLWAVAWDNSDDDADAKGINAAVSGKTVTLNHSSLSDDEVRILVFGF